MGSGPEVGAASGVGGWDLGKKGGSSWEGGKEEGPRASGETRAGFYIFLKFNENRIYKQNKTHISQQCPHLMS